jgi:hypothetical protein
MTLTSRAIGALVFARRLVLEADGGALRAVQVCVAFLLLVLLVIMLVLVLVLPLFLCSALCAGLVRLVGVVEVVPPHWRRDLA